MGLTSAYSETCLSHERLKREICHQFLQLLATGSSGRVNVRPTRTEEARSIAKRTSHVLVILRSSRSCWSLTTFVTEGRLRFRSTATLEDGKDVETVQENVKTRTELQVPNKGSLALPGMT